MERVKLLDSYTNCNLTIPHWLGSPDTGLHVAEHVIFEASDLQGKLYYATDIRVRLGVHYRPSSLLAIIPSWQFLVFLLGSQMILTNTATC